MTPKHIITVEHIWSALPISPRGPSTLSIRICDRCGLRQETLVLDEPQDKRSIKELAQSPDPNDRKYVMETTKELVEQFRQINDYRLFQEQELCEGNSFQTLREFAERLERRHQGKVQVNEVTFGIAQHIINTNSSKAGRKHTRKVLLAYKQGLVSDICNQVADSLDDLTEDHIVPRASGGSQR